MSDKEEENSTRPTMATETIEEAPHHPEITRKFNEFTFTIWPPTQRTRDAVIKRLIESLTAPSILSKRYGTLPADEASSAARIIEEEAFSVASSAGSSSAAANAAEDDDGIEILQIYSKEISKRMLEVVKSRAAAATVSAEKVDLESSDLTTATLPTSEEISSPFEPESS